MNKNKDWSDYYKLHKDRSASTLLQKSLNFVVNKDFALELGAGTPVDSVFLSNQGFNVFSVDISKQSEEMFSTVKDENINFKLSSILDIDYKENHYNLISAQRVLPFLIKKEDLFNILEKIKKSLKINGVFVGQFFGINDEWYKQGKEMTFINRDEFDDIFKDMKIVYKSEREEDSTTANGNPKHWHIFDFIVIKI